jgi:hypothetical protein
MYLRKELLTGIVKKKSVAPEVQPVACRILIFNETTIYANL